MCSKVECLVAVWRQVFHLADHAGAGATVSPKPRCFTTELCNIATFRSSFNRGAGQLVADGSTQRESPRSAVLKRACTRARARVCVCRSSSGLRRNRRTKTTMAKAAARERPQSLWLRRADRSRARRCSIARVRDLSSCSKRCTTNRRTIQYRRPQLARVAGERSDHCASMVMRRAGLWLRRRICALARPLAYACALAAQPVGVGMPACAGHLRLAGAVARSSRGEDR